MDLRKELLPPIREKEKIEAIKKLVNKIENLIYEHNDTIDLLDQLNKMLPGNTLIDEFSVMNYHSYAGIDEYVDILMTPDPKPVKDITKEEMLYIINMIEEDPCNENVEYYANLIDVSFPNKDLVSLILAPEGMGYSAQTGWPTAEDIVEKAFKLNIKIKE